MRTYRYCIQVKYPYSFLCEVVIMMIMTVGPLFSILGNNFKALLSAIFLLHDQQLPYTLKKIFLPERYDDNYYTVLLFVSLPDRWIIHIYYNYLFAFCMSVNYEGLNIKQNWVNLLCVNLYSKPENIINALFALLIN